MTNNEICTALINSRVIECKSIPEMVNNMINKMIDKYDAGFENKISAFIMSESLKNKSDDEIRTVVMKYVCKKTGKYFDESVFNNVFNRLLLTSKI